MSMFVLKAKIIVSNFHMPTDVPVRDCTVHNVFPLSFAIKTS